MTPTVKIGSRLCLARGAGRPDSVVVAGRAIPWLGRVCTDVPYRSCPSNRPHNSPRACRIDRRAARTGWWKESRTPAFNMSSVLTGQADTCSPRT